MAMVPAAPLLAAILLLLFPSPSSSIPIPSRYDGFVFPSSSSSSSSSSFSSSTVLLEAFFDPLCSDTADAWPVVKRVAQHYRANLTLIVHPFPLPYHHNAFFASRALHIINSLNTSYTYPMLELFFDNQDGFLNAATLEEAPSSVLDRVVKLAVDNFDELLPSELEGIFKAGFSEQTSDLATRISFKFGCSRAVVGTPYFFVNGIPLYNADSSWTFADWAEIIDPLLAESSKSLADA